MSVSWEITFELPGSPVGSRPEKQEAKVWGEIIPCGLRLYGEGETIWREEQDSWIQERRRIRMMYVLAGMVCVCVVAGALQEGCDCAVRDPEKS